MDHFKAREIFFGVWKGAMRMDVMYQMDARSLQSFSQRAPTEIRVMDVLFSVRYRISLLIMYFFIRWHGQCGLLSARYVNLVLSCVSP